MSDERPWEDYANPLPTHPVEGAGAYSNTRTERAKPT